MARILEGLSLPKDERLLVGIERLDDAGVYQLTEDLALVQTVDFFTPVVDDPYWFGQIAAANALSDVYAMGGRPLTALNIVCFPKDGDLSVLREILRGGLEKLGEAGAVLVGGHSVDDQEVKYGMAVTGLVHPQRVVRNAGARPGDQLVLTKPLGTGIAATAIKAQMCPEETLKAAIETMARLNKGASEAMVEVGVNASTDVTGFGLIGHVCEMLQDDIDFLLYASRVPLLPGVLELAQMGLVPGGLYRNRDYRTPWVEVQGVEGPVLDLLFDPQTSGGLLMAVPEDRVQRLLEELEKRGERGWVIGEVREGRGKVRVLP